MPETTSTFDLESCQQKLQSAMTDGKISQSAVENITTWLTEPRYSQYASDIARHIDQHKWTVLDDVFWTVIPFGTGGRRGKMYPFGSNAINERTIGESAQGLADYVCQTKPEGPWSAAIAYDTRHRSREFAELCAGILVANGFTVYFIDQYRSTPELSFLIRYKNCDCGIMVTASHNPPSDNAVKVYWSSGAQLIPPHDTAVIAKVSQVNEITAADFQQSVASGKIIFCTEQTDRALMHQQLKHSFAGPRDLKIIYSPLHGVGEFNVKSLLHEAGFTNLEIYQPHRQPDGDFPNVPGHVSNPENKEVFTKIIQHAKKTDAQLILATDPDCDRMGAAVPVTRDIQGPWNTLNGNQLAAILADYVFRMRSDNATLTPDHYMVTTLVTTRMCRRITQSYGAKCFDNNLVGFKWICSVVDREDPDLFVFGAEESHGYLVGQYCRDKDGAVACMLMSELAAWVNSQGKSLFEHLDSLFMIHGYHAEHLLTIRMEGSDGMRRMESLMNKFRSDMPAQLAGLHVAALHDYLHGQTVKSDGSSVTLDGPTDNLIILETEAHGNYVAVRPSGTEPKIKFYMFTYAAAGEITDLNETKQAMADRLAQYETTLREFAEHL